MGSPDWTETENGLAGKLGMARGQTTVQQGGKGHSTVLVRAYLQIWVPKNPNKRPGTRVREWSCKKPSRPHWHPPANNLGLPPPGKWVGWTCQSYNPRVNAENSTREARSVRSAVSCNCFTRMKTVYLSSVRPMATRPERPAFCLPHQPQPLNNLHALWTDVWPKAVLPLALET